MFEEEYMPELIYSNNTWEFSNDDEPNLRQELSLSCTGFLQKKLQKSVNDISREPTNALTSINPFYSGGWKKLAILTVGFPSLVILGTIELVARSALYVIASVVITIMAVTISRSIEVHILTGLICDLSYLGISLAYTALTIVQAAISTTTVFNCNNNIINDSPQTENMGNVNSNVIDYGIQMQRVIGEWLF
jgi:hypothetical protein